MTTQSLKGGADNAFIQGVCCHSSISLSNLACKMLLTGGFSGRL